MAAAVVPLANDLLFGTVAVEAVPTLSLEMQHILSLGVGEVVVLLAPHTAWAACRHLLETGVLVTRRQASQDRSPVAVVALQQAPQVLAVLAE